MAVPAAIGHPADPPSSEGGAVVDRVGAARHAPAAQGREAANPASKLAPSASATSMPSTPADMMPPA